MWLLWHKRARYLQSELVELFAMGSVILTLNGGNHGMVEDATMVPNQEQRKSKSAENPN